ncbi:MAG: hypothetical protein IKH65_09795 [Clostridia bacterium]|nr:hypothetical protein [Clostridia bacterium]MBR6941087.1 hypothetical protein [Clostridia bacterium]
MEIVGFDRNNHTQEMIYRALLSGRFPHTVILEGGLPEERLDLAVKIASALLCRDNNTVPCGECHSCRKIEHRTHPDVLILKPEKKEGSKNETYFVDYIRQIRDNAFIIPHESDLKIFILQEAQIMNDQAQNAFLKILEEPPEYVIFILLASTKSVYLPTILSRASVFTLGGETREVKDTVSRERAEAAAEAVCLALGNRYELVMAAGVFDKDQKLLTATLPILGEIFSDTLRVKYSAYEGEPPELCRNLASKFSKRTLLRLADDVNILTEALRQNANLNLTLARLSSLFKSAETEQE